MLGSFLGYVEGLFVHCEGTCLWVGGWVGGWVEELGGWKRRVLTSELQGGENAHSHHEIGRGEVFKVEPEGGGTAHTRKDVVAFRSGWVGG